MRVKMCATFTLGQGTRLDPTAIEAMHYLAGVANQLILTCATHEHALEVFQRELNLFGNSYTLDFVDHHNEPINLEVATEASIRISHVPYALH